jgi:hypothetical protein
MGRIARIPAALTRGPFTLTDARRAGLERWHLEDVCWRRLGPRTYVWAGRPEQTSLHLEAALKRLPASAAFSGLTAAWLHGLGVKPCDPIDVTVPLDAGVSARAGMALRRSSMQRDEVVDIRGMRATTLLWTLVDVSRRLALTEAVVLADMAMHAGLVEHDRFDSWVRNRVKGPGAAKVRRVVEHAEPKAESPMETRLRMLLVIARLPRPVAQVSLHDAKRRFLGRPDLYYPDRRLGIEYDGATHRESLAADNRRQNRLIGEGIQLLRFTAADVLHDQASVVAQVRSYLAR